MNKVTVVIPNYNGAHFMEDCLAALRAQTLQEFTVLVVDNASSDGSVELMQTRFPEVELICMDTNTGFAAAVNAGIKASKTPYVCLLNNDTKAAPEFLEELVKAIEGSKKIFSVASKMIQMYHQDLLDSAGDSYNILGWGVNRGVGRSRELYDKAEDVFSACAGAALYRRCVFEQIGYFDEAHFAYLEDIDVCWRAKAYGFRNVYCPTAVVEHVGSGTSGSRYNEFKVRLAARNNLYLIYKNMPAWQLVMNAPALFLGTAVKFGFFLVKGFSGAYLEGLKEGAAMLEKAQKVPAKNRRLYRDIALEGELIVNLAAYTAEWFKRKLHID